MFLGLGKLDSCFPECLELDPEVVEVCELWGVPVFPNPELAASDPSFWLLPKSLET